MKLQKLIQIFIKTMGSIQRKAFFPAPEKSYTDISIKMMVKDVETYKYSYQSGSDMFISPLIFLPFYISKDQISPVCLLYFHGNAEDIGHSIELLDEFRSCLKANIFALEYPGYGPSTQTEKDPDQIKQNALALYRIVNQAGFSHQSIVIFGRSIGTGPASFIAGALPEVKHVVLMSPLSSVTKVTRDYSTFASFFVSNYFDNANWMKKTKARLLVIHGKADQVIPFHNGVEVVQAYNSTHENKAVFEAIPTISHNSFSLREDIMRPTKNFMPKGDVPKLFSEVNNKLELLTSQNKKPQKKFS